MTNASPPPENARWPVPELADADKVLAHFFRAEMPKPWPGCPPLAIDEANTSRPDRAGVYRVFGSSSRLVVAAVAAVLVIGFLALQSRFPDPRPPATLHIDKSQTIGFNIKPGQFLDRTPAGRPVKVEVEQTSDPKKIILKIEELPAKK